MKNKYLTYIIFTIIIITFAILYGRMIYSLPLFGDATIHGRITKDIINYSIINSKCIIYPPLYNAIQSVLFSSLGERGMNSIIFIGVLFIAVSIFLLIRLITEKDIIALIGMITVLASPKLIFYSARMYMEILVSGFFIFTIFFLFKYIKNKTYTNLILLSLFTAITASIKQQGLFILFPCILIFLIILYIFKRLENDENSKNILTKKHLIGFVLIFVLIASIPYLVLFHSDGQLYPGLDEFAPGRIINLVGQKISNYKKPLDDINFEKKWDQKLLEIQSKYYTTAAAHVESRHIMPLDPVLTWDGFLKTNSLYISGFVNSYTSKSLETIMGLFIILGLIVVIYNAFFNVGLFKKNRSLLVLFLLFFFIFILINYILFIRNNDQMRYHIFVPILFSIFSSIGMYSVINFFHKRTSRIDKIAYSLIILVIIVSSLKITYYDTTLNNRWIKSQIYASSKGGISSIKEAGQWIKSNSNETDIMWQTCGNEINYYSGRKTIGNTWYYFLNPMELKNIFMDQKIKFILIFDSQIVEDCKWNNFCNIPISFSEKITNIYPLVYRTTFNDISIYRVEK